MSSAAFATMMMTTRLATPCSESWPAPLPGLRIGMSRSSKRFGGLDGLTSAVRRRMSDASGGKGPSGATQEPVEAEDDFDDGDDELMGDDYDGAIEERVLSVFQNDPILSERAIDIGSLGDNVIELEGLRERARPKPSTR